MFWSAWRRASSLRRLGSAEGHERRRRLGDEDKGVEGVAGVGGSAGRLGELEDEDDGDKSSQEGVTGDIKVVEGLWARVLCLLMRRRWYRFLVFSWERGGWLLIGLGLPLMILRL